MADKKEKKPNIFVRMWKRCAKFFKDVIGEMKKVSWTSKSELAKNTRLVLVTVVAFGVAIALIDFCSSRILVSIAGLIGY